MDAADRPGTVVQVAAAGSNTRDELSVPPPILNRMGEGNEVDPRVAASDSWDLVIATDDQSVARRRRALAPIQVLSELERSKSSLDGDFWDRYDLFSIALAVIDQVALAMSISAGRTWDETLAYAVTQAQRQAPDGGNDQWERVAHRVLTALVTTEVESVPYLVLSDDTAVWRDQRFRLLYAHASSTGDEEHLRASEAAINVFINALDLDIEAAQIANEAQLRALIARGAVESAAQIAQIAQYQSAQYLERTRRILADTMIDPDSHDWIDIVPAMLDRALTHVRDRMAAEAEIDAALTEQRENVTDAHRVGQINELLERLRDCKSRHSALHLHLIGARGRHRTALEERLARPVRHVRRVDIGTGLLQPLLARTSTDGAGVAERLIAAVGGISTRWLSSLDDTAAMLLAPRREPGDGELLDEPEFDSDDHGDWWEPYEELVDSLLNGIDDPTRLSQLLARADDLIGTTSDEDGEPLDPFVLAASVVHNAHRRWAPQLSGRSEGDRFVIAVDDDADLETSHVACKDLLLVPVEVLRNFDTPDDTPGPAT
jgi:hypothetical protein